MNPTDTVVSGMNVLLILPLILFIIWFVQMCMITSRLGHANRYLASILIEQRKFTGTPAPNWAGRLMGDK